MPETIGPADLVSRIGRDVGFSDLFELSQQMIDMFADART